MADPTGEADEGARRLEFDSRCALIASGGDRLAEIRTGRNRRQRLVGLLRQPVSGQRLAGHSDADVGLYVLTDSVPGAIGVGDIGMHCPPSDRLWRGAASDQFLRHAADLVRAGGRAVASVDVTIICERPKIGPHRAAMVERVAEILGIAAGRVKVKATTTGNLGSTGRGEGIAAQAVAALRLPL